MTRVSHHVTIDASAVEALIRYGLTVKRRGGVVWDPSCFFGGIAETLDKSRDLDGREFTVLATDTRSRWSGCRKEQDFLAVPLAAVSSAIEIIMTRPPTARRAEFVQHALDIAEKNEGAVLMLMPPAFHNMRLRELFEEKPFAALFPISDEWTWFYWDYRYDGELKTIRLEAA